MQATLRKWITRSFIAAALFLGLSQLGIDSNGGSTASAYRPTGALLSPPQLGPSTVTVRVDRGVQIGASRLQMGVTHTHYSADPWHDPEAVAAARSLLQTASTFQNQHIMGWGVSNPEPYPGVYDWQSLDARVNLIRQTGGTPVITLCCAPDWMKGGQPGQTDWSRIEVAPYPEHYADFAELARQVALRYPDVRHYQVWNELKGFFDTALNRWNYEAYTTLYNLVYDAVKRVNPLNKVGGPYVVLDSWGCHSCMSHPSSLRGPYGTFDQRPLDVISYWLQNKRGADFISVDAWSRNWDGVQITSEFIASQKFADAAAWISQQPGGGSQLPIWWSEWYATPWGTAEQWEHQHQNAAMASVLMQMARSGAGVALRWQPQGIASDPYEGNTESIWRDTRLPGSSGGGAAFPYYQTARWMKEWFGPNTALYRVEVSAPAQLMGMASAQKVMLANTTSSPLEVLLDQGGAPTSLTLAPFEVRLLDANPPASTPVPTPLGGSVRFAVIGDYGNQSSQSLQVADMVRSWNVDFIITTGDNNYPDGAASTIDGNIGRGYFDFIHPYVGSRGTGAPYNKFWPSLGNHDWDCSGCPSPYQSYFVLPGNERYYDIAPPVRGNVPQNLVHLFPVSTDTREPNGVTATSPQAQWLQSRLAASTARWKIVYGHHPPYTSGSTHTPSTYMRWPYQQWGASAVLSGHNHQYERLSVNGFPYFVNGAGGASLYGWGTIMPESQFRYNSDWGAQLVEATTTQLTFRFMNRAGTVIDTYTIPASGGTPPPVRTPTRTPTGQACSLRFSDVRTSDYFYNPVQYLYCRGVITGYADNTFRPYTSATRGQLCKIVVLAQSWSINTAGGPHFRDVPTNHSFYQYVETAYNRDIITGYSCGAGCLEFRPGANITRGQLCKIVVNAEGWSINTAGGPHFRDVPTNHSFYQYVETAYNRDIITGYNCGSGCLEFRSGNSATRGQICTIVYNALTAPR